MFSRNRRVAIYLPTSEWFNPEVGGTFSIAQSLMIEVDKRKELENNFVLMVDNDADVLLFESQIKNLEIIALNWHPQNPIVDIANDVGLLQRNKNRLVNILNRLNIKPEKSPLEERSEPEENSGQADLSFDNFFKNFAFERNISMIFYPIQHVCLSDTVPFIATNWDIAHKSTFIFPEISKIIDQREDWYKNILPKALSVFCESEAGKKELKKYYQVEDNKVRIQPLIPGAVIDIEVDYETQLYFLDELKVTSQNYFFYPAQFWALKNHKTLVEAFHLLAKDHRDLKLVLTGSDQGNFDYIKKICESMGIDDIVIMPGFVDNDRLYTLYVNAIALVMPTFLGPTNMPILEAMALNCPVLCSDLDGHMEILGSKEQMFSPLDADDIKSKMKRCFLDKQFRQDVIHYQIEKYSTSKFNKQFSVDYLMKNIRDIFKVRELWA